MDHRQPLDPAVLADDVDHAPVRELRDDERRDVRERRLVVERRCEDVTGLGEQTPCLRQVRLLLVDGRRPDRGRGQARHRARSARILGAEVAPAARVEDERADDLLTVVQRRRDHGDGPLGRVCRLVLGRQPRDRRDVVHDERRVERDHVLVPLNRRGRRGDVVAGEAGRRLQRPGVVVGIAAPERVRIDRESRLREVEHIRQDRVEIEGAEKSARRLDKHPQSLDLLRLSGEEFVDRGRHDLLGHGGTVVSGEGKSGGGDP